MDIKNSANLLINFTIKELAEIFGVIVSSCGIFLLCFVELLSEDPNFIFLQIQKLKIFLGFKVVLSIYFSICSLISYLISLTIITGINIFRTKIFF